MDPTLTWLLLIVAAVLMLLGALRLDLLALLWRSRMDKPPTRHDAPPAGERGG